MISIGLFNPMNPSTWKPSLKPFSVMKNIIDSRMVTAGYVGAAVVADVARSGRSRTDAVICNWKGLNMKYVDVVNSISYTWFYERRYETWQIKCSLFTVVPFHRSRFRDRAKVTKMQLWANIASFWGWEHEQIRSITKRSSSQINRPLIACRY